MGDYVSSLKSSRYFSDLFLKVWLFFVQVFMRQQMFYGEKRIYPTQNLKQVCFPRLQIEKYVVRVFVFVFVFIYIFVFVRDFVFASETARSWIVYFTKCSSSGT